VEKRRKDKRAIKEEMKIKVIRGETCRRKGEKFVVSCDVSFQVS
jgi:hypothetical protein